MEEKIKIPATKQLGYAIAQYNQTEDRTTFLQRIDHFPEVKTEDYKLVLTKLETYWSADYNAGAKFKELADANLFIDNFLTKDKDCIYQPVEVCITYSLANKDWRKVK